MSIFGLFRRKRRKKKNCDEPKADPRPDETAPGVRAMKELWVIDPARPDTRVEGEVVTDIYATQRPNGVPRRRHPPRRSVGSDDFVPPY
jgi:hypothetical protein